MANATVSERRDALKVVYHEASGCVRCALAETRTNVVFGAGDADADLMFVGEAPGRHEDEQGLPFVGQAGKLLDRLLGEIGMERSDVWINNVLCCRPPGNRDPQPSEIEACQDYLFRKIELIQPRVICTLGNFSTKLLRNDATGITRIHGQPEVRVIGTRAVRLFPLYHPAAALYTRSMLDVLQADFAKLPALVAEPPPDQPVVIAVEREPELQPEDVVPAEPVAEAGAEVEAPDTREAEAEAVQLGLF
jgi:DNA polymerase